MAKKTEHAYLAFQTDGTFFDPRGPHVYLCKGKHCGLYVREYVTWPAAAVAAKRNGLTLVDLVRPLMFHSSISAGASTDVTFAASINGSLMMLTVNCFVASIFSLVSLDFCGE
jgi:hypothetical protein